jgi:hypothetical protein
MAKFTIEQFYTNFFRSLKDRNDRYAAQLCPALALALQSPAPAHVRTRRSVHTGARRSIRRWCKRACPTRRR